MPLEVAFPLDLPTGSALQCSRGVSLLALGEGGSGLVPIPASAELGRLQERRNPPPEGAFRAGWVAPFYPLYVGSLPVMLLNVHGGYSWGWMLLEGRGFRISPPRRRSELQLEEQGLGLPLCGRGFCWEAKATEDECCIWAGDPTKGYVLLADGDVLHFGDVMVNALLQSGSARLGSGVWGFVGWGSGRGSRRD